MKKPEGKDFVEKVYDLQDNIIKPIMDKYRDYFKDRNHYVYINHRRSFWNDSADLLYQGIALQVWPADLPSHQRKPHDKDANSIYISFSSQYYKETITCYHGINGNGGPIKVLHIDEIDDEFVETQIKWFLNKVSEKLP